MDSRIKRLLKIADFLDLNNRIDDANLIDEIISKDSESEPVVSVTEEELDFLRKIHDALGQSLE